MAMLLSALGKLPLFDNCFYYVAVLLRKIKCIIQLFVSVNVVKLARWRSWNKSEGVGVHNCHRTYIYEGKESSKLCV